MNTNVFHRRLDYKYPLITRCEGVFLFDSSQNRYIDAASGAGVTSIGHGNKDIANQIGRLAEDITYLHGAQFTTQDMEDYARELCDLSGNRYSHVMFFSSGSEGNESAVKLARQYHLENGDNGKYRVISRHPSYHGATIGMLSVTGKQNVREAYQPYLYEENYVSTPNYYRRDKELTERDYALESAKQLQTLIERLGADTISAFIFEPVVGASMGCVVPDVEYYKEVRKICSDNNVLLISDEVMSGFGRCGEWFASDLFDLEPDIAVTGKGISGGYVPLSAVFCTSKIYNSIKDGSGMFSHGFTYENTPFSCGVGRIILSHMKKNKCVENSKKQGEYLLSRLKQEFSDYESVGDIRGRGLFIGVELVQDRITKKPYPRKLRLAENVITNGLFKLDGDKINLYYSTAFLDNGDGDAIMIMPPLNIKKSEVDIVIKKFKETLDMTLKQIGCL